MGPGLIISLVLHSAVLFSVIAVFPSARALPKAPTPLPVDLITQAELTKIKAGERKAKAEAGKAEKKPEPVKQKAKKKTKASQKKTVKAPVPKPEPKPKKAEAPPKPVKKVVKAKPKPKPKPKKAVKKRVKKRVKVASKPKRAPKAKKEFNPDKIAALLNKVPDAGTRAPAASQQAKKTAPARGRTDGANVAMTFNEIDALRAKISQCWNPPVGGLGADAIRVRLRLQLRKDGGLTSTPQVVNRMASPFFQAAADAAVRAVMLCQPYNELPARKYAQWRDMILNFDPQEMFGG